MAVCQRNNHLLAGGRAQIFSVLGVILTTTFLLFYLVTGAWKTSLFAAGIISAALLMTDFLTFKIRDYFAKKLYSQISSNK